MTPERFDLWFNAVTPVDTSGAPDETVTYLADGRYEKRVTLSATKYVHVKAVTSADVEGPGSEVLVTIPTASESAPDSQYSPDTPEPYPL